MKDFIIGTASCLAVSCINVADVQLWVSVVCSALITFVTCFVQIHRLWRDRDKDLKTENKEKEQEGGE